MAGQEPAPPNPTLQMSREEMRTLGYRVVDTLVEHFVTLADQPCISHASRHEMDWLLQEALPEQGMPAHEVFDHVEKTVLANSARLNHPRWFSFVPGTNNFVSTMADALATGFDVFSGAWVSSPGAAELEIVTTNWLLGLFGLPVREGGGTFVSGGSMANLTGLAAARKVKLDNQMEGARLYWSDQAHSSVDRAALVLGFQPEHIRKLPCDEAFRLPMPALREAVEADLAAGLRPFCVVANAGSTNTGSVDPLREIALLCQQKGLWMHVDAAYGGGAIMTPEGRAALTGIELADSITVDPHKWFFQPYEIGCILVRNYHWLAGTFRLQPEYLRDLSGASEEINFYDFGIQLTRRFRALKFYMSLKTFGLASFREAVEASLELGRETARQFDQADKWELMAPPSLAIVNFRYKPRQLNLTEAQIDALNLAISKRMIESGEAMLATTVLNGRTVLRMCLINPLTNSKHVRETLDTLETFAREEVAALEAGA